MNIKDLVGSKIIGIKELDNGDLIFYLDNFTKITIIKKYCNEFDIEVF